MYLIRFILACFSTFADPIYSHHLLHIRFKIFAQIHICIFVHQIKYLYYRKYSLQSEYSLKIVSYWRIFASKYSFRSKYSQNFTFKRIFACKYTHTLLQLFRKAFHKPQIIFSVIFENICLERNIHFRFYSIFVSPVKPHIRIHANIRYVLHCFKFFRKAFHKPQLIFSHFWKYLLRKDHSLPFLFVSYVKSALMRNKWLKLFYIRFIFAFIRFKPMSQINELGKIRPVVEGTEWK